MGPDDMIILHIARMVMIIILLLFYKNAAVILMSLNYKTHVCYLKSHFGMVL